MIAELDKIEDEFYRGFATHQVIKMCYLATDMSVCRALLVGVRDSFLREQIMESTPDLYG